MNIPNGFEAPFYTDITDPNEIVLRDVNHMAIAVYHDNSQWPSDCVDEWNEERQGWIDFSNWQVQAMNTKASTFAKFIDFTAGHDFVTHILVVSLDAGFPTNFQGVCSLCEGDPNCMTPFKPNGAATAIRQYRENAMAKGHHVSVCPCCHGVPV